MLTLDSLVRRLVDNRRTHPRVKRPYTVVIYNDRKREIFRGKVLDLSRSGIGIVGLPVGQGILYGQHVRIELLLLPNDLKKVSEVAVAWGWVCRLEEHRDGIQVAVKFEQNLPEDK